MRFCKFLGHVNTSWLPERGKRLTSTLCMHALLCAFFLTSCGVKTTELTIIESEPVSHTFNTPIPTDDSSYFENEYELKIRASDIKPGKYEPEYGCYLGAYVLSDKIIDGKIGNFERAVGIEHAFYTYSMASGSEYPESWVLECIARMKMPSVTINPPGKTDLYSIPLITKTAKEIGAYNLPVFVHLYPYSKDAGFTAKEYVNFYREAAGIFSQYAPLAALVWDVYFEDVYDCSAFYPGDEYADWVGVRVCLNVTADGLYKDALNYLSYFYYNYQKVKPVMVSELAVSHFTTENNAYYTEQAVQEIERLYGTIAKSYPRIKAVAYMSFNSADMGQNKNLHNYSITEEDLLKQSYNKAASSSAFLAQVVTEKLNNPHIMIKSPFPAYYKNGEYYAAHKTLEHDMKLSDLRLLASKAVLILGEKYYSMGVINSHKPIDFFVDNERGMMVLEVK